MKALELLARIKWAPVIILVLVLIIFYFLIFSPGPKMGSPFSPGYKSVGDIQMRAWADPGTVTFTGESKAKVEVKNGGTNSANIRIKLTAYDSNMSFTETGNQEVSASFGLGPKESREVPFSIDFNATYPGRYTVKVTVSPGGENIVDEIFFDVKEKK